MNYQQMDLEHQRLLQKIRNQEDEKQIEPQDYLQLTSQISSIIESTNEYIEDPKNQIARNQSGQIIRCKLKISLSYKGILNSSGNFKNVHIQLQLPRNVYSEQTSFKYESLVFNQRQSTPQIQSVYLYVLNKECPVEAKVSITATYS